jgi:Fic family protein
MPIGADSLRAGRYITQPTGYRAFVPALLPPNPPLEFDGETLCLHEQATVKVGRLEGLTVNLPNPDLFLSMYVRKEALLSSQIEGTQASLDDVLTYEVENGNRPAGGDVDEVVNYVRAMKYGLARLQEFPLSLRLIREIHAELLRGVRGGESARTPGDFRITQNWIGPPGCTLAEATFVPPPPEEMKTALYDLEKFLHAGIPLPMLVQCALVHAQFETIHPFLDGNGRVGRLLITLLLCHSGMLQRPLLYLSYYFKAHRNEYYDRLNAIRANGAWEEWLRFFLRGVAVVAQQAAETAEKILKLRDTHVRTIHDAYPRASANAIKLLDCLFEQPYVTTALTTARLGISTPTANVLLTRFVDAGLLKEVTGKSYGRVYRYDPYVALLREGTEP